MDIENRMSEVIEKYGDWTAYDIKISDTLYTKQERSPFFQLRKVVQLIKDLSNSNLSQLRILDLGCLEGQYSIELGMQGATVIGIEGRQANIERAKFARDALKLDNVQFIQDDVRNLTKKKYGEFDVVLCSGILYHLNFPDNLHFLENIYDVCRHFAIIDTHIAMQSTSSKFYNGNNYLGDIYIEHAPSATPEERLENVWASLDNSESFWLSKKSLYEFLMRIGFTTIQEVFTNNQSAKFIGDRACLVAYKGESVELKTSPATNGVDEPLDRMVEMESLIQRLIKNNELSKLTINQIINLLIQYQSNINN